MPLYESIHGGYLSDKFGASINNSILASHNAIMKYDLQPWIEFDRYYTIDINKELPSGKHYIFMTRPELNILADGNAIQLRSDTMIYADSFFRYMQTFYPHILSSLTKTFNDLDVPSTSFGSIATGIDGGTYSLGLHDFLPYITSRAESLQIPDYELRAQSVVQPYTQYSLPYTVNGIESTTGGSFSLTLREDKDYSIHKLFYTLAYYQNGVSINKFAPSRESIREFELDYAVSVYDFLVDETSQNILYWGKYTGCVTNGSPLSNLSFNRGATGETDVSINFNYFLYEPMKLETLLDFQRNSLGDLLDTTFKGVELNPPIKTVPLHNPEFNVGASMVGRPIIKMYKNSRGRPVMQLLWVE